MDEQPQERHVLWPQIFIIPRESVRSQVLAKLDKRLSLTESDRTFVFSTTFDVCVTQIARFIFVSMILVVKRKSQK